MSNPYVNAHCKMIEIALEPPESPADTAVYLTQRYLDLPEDRRINMAIALIMVLTTREQLARSAR
ncbi:MAG: hypothetical protein V4712_15150 [Pseudomonadota bacterium]